MNSWRARPEQTLQLGCLDHPDAICRTAGYVIRMSGGVGGGETVRSLPIPIDMTSNVKGCSQLLLSSSQVPMSSRCPSEEAEAGRHDG